VFPPRRLLRAVGRPTVWEVSGQPPVIGQRGSLSIVSAANRQAVVGAEV